MSFGVANSGEQLNVVLQVQPSLQEEPVVELALLGVQAAEEP
jgi:hypothetical protein